MGRAGLFSRRDLRIKRTLNLCKWQLTYVISQVMQGIKASLILVGDQCL